MRNPEHEKAAKVEQLTCIDGCMALPNKDNDDVMHERCRGASQNMRPQTLDPSLTSRHSVHIEFRPNYAT